MPPSAKTIREDLARAKAAYSKNDDLRVLQLLLSALRAFVTVHPSYLLRVPDEEAKRREYRAFVEDLRSVGRLARGDAQRG